MCVFGEVAPYREVWGVDVDMAAGFERSPLREAGKWSLLLRLNLFNLPNPLHADSTRERNPLSAALDYSNSCVTSPQSVIAGYSLGKIWIYSTI